MQVINIPAPEEVRSWPEFVKLLRSQNDKAGSDYLLKKHRYPSGITIKEYFEWCWEQPEAEMIHKAFTE